MGRIAKPKVGDVFEVTLRDGQLAYLQVVHEQSGGDISEVVRVLEGRFASRPSDLPAVVAEPHEYLMFAAPRFMAAEGHARRVGNWPVPQRGGWSGLKYTLVLGRDGHVQAWVLSDGRTPLERSEVPPPISKRREAPVWQLGPSLDVVDTLMASREGSLEGSEIEKWRAAHGLQGSMGLADDDDESAVQHFTLFREGADLGEVVAQLESLGFGCSRLTNPDLFDGQLLVVKVGHSEPASIGDQRKRIEQIVRAAGGGYDGWEATTGKPGDT